MAQTKETLTLRTSSFGSKCDVSDAKFLKKLDACGITELVNAFATFKNEKELKKTDGAKRQRITGALPGTPTPTHVCLRCLERGRLPKANLQVQGLFWDFLGLLWTRLAFVQAWYIGMSSSQGQDTMSMACCTAGLTKLDDANNAGGRNSEQCTLILTEGDSAKSLVIAGMSVAGRDNFGVFPLR